MYDSIVIGAGPAGITASVYLIRKRLNIVVITNDIGGQTTWSGDIENYTGYQFITGPELSAKFEEHIKKYNIDLKNSEKVMGLQKKGDTVIIKTTKATYEAKSAIVASGKESRELGVPGEAEFKNKGLTYCATCDGPLFSGKDVAIIGGGNSALDAALQLIKIAKHVYVINIAAQITGDAIMSQKVTGSKNVTILNNTQVTAVLGKEMVNGLNIKSNGKEKKLDVQGVFVEIGLIPNSDFVTILKKNEFGEIKVNYHNETNIPGIFAAGDVTDVPEKQIIIAGGEGAKAALGVFKYLSQKK